MLRVWSRGRWPAAPTLSGSRGAMDRWQSWRRLRPPAGSHLCVSPPVRATTSPAMSASPRTILVGALDAFGAALERTIDLGDVNGRPFLNNVSLGIYADAVQQPGYRDAKLRTLLETAQEEALGSSSTPADVHLVDDRGAEHRSPAVVLVSNNPYAFERPPVRGARPVLDGGQLGIVVIDAPNWSSAPCRPGLERAVATRRGQRNGPGRSRRRGGRSHPAPPFHAPPESSPRPDCARARAAAPASARTSGLSARGVQGPEVAVTVSPRATLEARGRRPRPGRPCG